MLDLLEGEAGSYLRRMYGECTDAIEIEANRRTNGEIGSDRALTLYRRFLTDLVASQPTTPKVAPLVVTAQRCLADARKHDTRLDVDLAQIYRQAERQLMQLQSMINALGRGASGGLAHRISRSGHYADRFRAMIADLRPGAIDGWWDYSRFAASGVEPNLRLIEGVGKRLYHEQSRLRDAMEVMRSEATRGNTSHLVAVSEATGASTDRLVAVMAEIQTLAHSMQKLQKRFGTTGWVYTLLLILVTAIGLALALFALLSGKCGVPLKLGPVSITWPC
jgi:hypothetical protein